MIHERVLNESILTANRFKAKKERKKLKACFVMIISKQNVKPIPLERIFMVCTLIYVHVNVRGNIAGLNEAQAYHPLFVWWTVL